MVHPTILHCNTLKNSVAFKLLPELICLKDIKFFIEFTIKTGYRIKCKTSKGGTHYVKQKNH